MSESRSDPKPTLLDELRLTRQEFKEAAAILRAKLAKRGVWLTAKRVAEYALTPADQREALLEKRRAAGDE